MYVQLPRCYKTEGKDFYLLCLTLQVKYLIQNYIYTCISLYMQLLQTSNRAATCA